MTRATGTTPVVRRNGASPEFPEPELDHRPVPVLREECRQQNGNFR